MQIPRWLQVLCVLIGINLAAVTFTSIWHLATAQAASVGDGVQDTSTDQAPDDSSTSGDEPPADVPSLTYEPEQESEESPLPAGSLPSLAPPGSDEQPGPEQGAAPSLSLPDQLPALPESSGQDLENDPIFQEFQRMFSDTSAVENAEGNLPAGARVALSALENRLEGVHSLLDAALATAREAHEHEVRGEATQAGELRKLSDQLRTMAAQLLVRDF